MQLNSAGKMKVLKGFSVLKNEAGGCTGLQMYKTV